MASQMETAATKGNGAAASERDHAGRLIASEAKTPQHDNQAPSVELVSSEMRHVSACLRFVTAEVDMIGTQLRCGAITVEQAQWMVNHLSDPADILRNATQ